MKGVSPKRLLYWGKKLKELDQKTGRKHCIDITAKKWVPIDLE